MTPSIPARPRRFRTIPIRALAAAVLAFWIVACYALRTTQGGGEISGKKAQAPRQADPADIALPEGYRIEAAARGFTFPTGVAFDDSGGIFVIESGYVYGETWTEPRLIEVGPGGRLTTLAAGDSNGPWNGITWHAGGGGGAQGGGSGAFYVAEGGAKKGGRILRITRDGRRETLVEGLPSFGDHHTNAPVIGPDGMLYFGQGTATNSGVVGLDNGEFGWLERFPGFHDRPCRDVVLAGVNYATANPLTPEKEDSAVTGAFLPFGSRSLPGQVVAGGAPCNGSVMRVPLAGGAPQVVAWGFRNPFALAFSPEGGLYVLDNGYDERGSRPVWGAADLLWKVEEGAWYGWPDHSGSQRLDRGGFKPPGRDGPSLLLREAPGPVPEPAAYLPVHSSADGLDFSTSGEFGHRGQAFVALFGDMAPKVGKTLAPVGFKVVRVDPENGVIEDFAVNRKGPHGPASLEGSGGLERPVGLRFAPGGRVLYVVDFGVLRVTSKGPEAVPGTGVLWRISRKEET